MQMRKPNLSTLVRRFVGGAAAAPVMATLALASTVIMMFVALGALGDGRLPANGSIAIVCALVLAAVAAVEASRPARTERVRRRIGPDPD